MIIFLVVLLLLAWAAQRYTLTHAFDGVVYETRASTDTVDPDEQFDVVTTLENGKRMPVMYLRVQEKLPPGACVHTEGIPTLLERDGMRTSFRVYLLGRQKLERRVLVSLPVRGRYFLRGGQLAAGDFFGLSETIEYVPRSHEIVVMPRTVEAPALQAMLGGYLGDRSVSRFIMEDPVLTLGFREYTGREPQKQISWTQSARFGRLMVKRYDYTLEQTVTVVLNIACETLRGAALHARIEQCFSLARGVCEELERRGISYDFLTNAAAAGAMGLWNTLADGLGHEHLRVILEGLGRATYDSTEPFTQTLDRALRRAEHGRGHIIITPAQSDVAGHALARLRELTGGDVCTLAACALFPEEEAEQA